MKIALQCRFDIKYSWSRELVNGFYSFHGYTDSELFYDDRCAGWRLQLRSDPEEVYAVTAGQEYPFGAREWTVHGDAGTAEPVVTAELSVHACNDSEFNCREGSCISLEQKCDGRVDCPDRSGEYLGRRTQVGENCHMFPT